MSPWAVTRPPPAHRPVVLDALRLADLEHLGQHLSVGELGVAQHRAPDWLGSMIFSLELQAKANLVVELYSSMSSAAPAELPPSWSQPRRE